MMNLEQTEEVTFTKERKEEVSAYDRLIELDRNGRLTKTLYQHRLGVSDVAFIDDQSVIPASVSATYEISLRATAYIETKKLGGFSSIRSAQEHDVSEDEYDEDDAEGNWEYDEELADQASSSVSVDVWKTTSGQELGDGVLLPSERDPKAVAFYSDALWSDHSKVLMVLPLAKDWMDPALTDEEMA